VTSATTTLLVTGTLLLGAVAVASCVALVIHHALSEVVRARRERRADGALALLVGSIVGGDDLDAVAALAVKRFGHAAVGEVLRRARNDIAGERAAAITVALEAIGEVERLRRRARSRNVARRRTAIRHLGECGGDVASTVLRAALDDSEWEVRRAARDGLLADGRPEAIRLAVDSYLAEATENLGWRRSFYARFALVAPAQLCELLHTASLNPAEEKLAIEALGHARSENAVPEIRARLTSADPELRASSARFAGKLCDHDSAPGLVALLTDPEWFVRAAAARGLETLPKPPSTLRALGTCLSDPSWWVRSNAARSLSRAGEPGRAILRSVIDGDDAYARDAARAALATLRSATVPDAAFPDVAGRVAAEPQAVPRC